MNLTPSISRARPAGTRGAVLVSALAITGLVLTGCSSSDDNGSKKVGTSADSRDTADSSEAADSAATADSDATASGPDTTGDSSGRAFDATDDAVVTALMAATPAKKVEWRGDTLWVTFDEGSVEDITTGMYCRVSGGLLEDGEPVMLAYPDGEIDCLEEGQEG